MKFDKKPLFLITIIYLSFISLGLPDGLLGVAWPSIRGDMGLPLESVGVLTTLLLCMSALSSILSGWVLRRLGTGTVTFLSCLMTGLGLLGYSLSPGFGWLILCTVPLGFGQGAVDSGLNRYVADHYSSRHMNWLHCFWGMGASIGPVIMSQAVTSGRTWRGGYRTVSAMQLTLAAILLVSVLIKLWQDRPVKAEGESNEARPKARVFGKFAPSLAVFLFFIYAGMEFTIGVWLNSVLVESRALPVAIAGLCVTLYYGAIMVGRFLCGIVVNRMGNMRMIRLGLVLAVAGGLVLWFVPASWGAMVGISMIGVGIGPVYPCLMHETPARFDKATSDKLIGYQVGAACLGGSLLASGLGVFLSHITLELFFPVVVVLLGVNFFINELLERKAKAQTEDAELPAAQ
ncbi:MFS transporter [Zongyangia hominis]|uniref:MFS transporter n=1 Tax=Zongyangia hominis TaxID=2763677 RepID=A0A926IAQ2_9FIRM|nr:MFS transporter [Zongyangia hominis]MBC8569448.1 MFS transporter [Zongyangia hominis]